MGVFASGHDETTDAFFQGTGINADPSLYGGGDYTAGGVGRRTDIVERDRYRGLGEAAANRAAYNVDFDVAQDDRNNGAAARRGQMVAVGLQRQAAMGSAPSRAAIMGNQAAGQSLEATLAGSAGARTFGGRSGPGMAAAQMAARQGQGGMQLGAQQQAMGMRSGEMNVARGAFGAGASEMRAGDYTAQGMAQEQAEAQAKAEMAQRHLNQSAQMGYEQMGVNTEQAALDGRMRTAGVANAQQQTANANKDANDDRWWKYAKAASSAVPSDERVKQAISALDESGNSTVDEDGGGIPSESKPRIPHKPAFGAASSFIPRGKATDPQSTPGYITTTTKPQVTPPHATPAPDKPPPMSYFASLASRLRTMVSDEGAKAATRPLATTSATGKADPNVITPGNINHYGRASIDNHDGTTSTVRSMSFNDGKGREVLIPTAYDGAIHSEEEAIANYRKTGQHMGIFKTPEAATAHAQKVHEDYENGKYQDGPARVMEQRAPKASDKMTNALASGLKPYQYEYKPGFAEHEGQQQGEKNVGPMAQDMASNPITGQAVQQGPDGLLQIDMKKATKLSLAAAGHNAQKIRELEAKMGGR